MSLVGVEMVFFLPAVFLVHWILLPRHSAVQNAWLLLASLFFYASWGPRFLPVFLLSAAVDWVVGLRLGTETNDRRRRILLGISLVWNLGALAFFKYQGFFAETVNASLGAIGLPSSLPVLRIALPLGLSYVTLQKLAYVIDVYYRRIPPCRSALTFFTFVSFFPQLIAGPIPRPRQLIPQYEVARRLTPDFLARGAGAFLIGYVMKAFGANWLGPTVVDPVFADSAHFDRASHVAALLGYAAQVFFDFAGYSLLAIGAGRLLGLELPENFRRPFLSRSLLELWQRWHITLNTWLFDYIYGPLTTGRSWMRGRYQLGFVIVFLASGLWHGAQWTFVFWGLLHGLGLVMHYRWDLFYKSLCRKDRVWVARRKSTPYTLVAWALTQTFFVLTLVPFRAPSLGAAAGFFEELVRSPGPRMFQLVSMNDKVAALLLMGFFLVYHAAAFPPGRRALEAFLALPAPVRGIAYGAAVVLLALFVPIGAGTFIYANF